MNSIHLEIPPGIEARLGADPGASAWHRHRTLARELVAERFRVERKAVGVLREAPAGFGSEEQSFAEITRTRIPLRIRTAHFGAATTVALVEPGVRLGLDLRDPYPDEGAVAEMQLHSHLFDEDNVDSLLRHWTKVQVVLDADGRGARLRPEYVRLDPLRSTGWVLDMRAHYSLLDLSRDGWIIMFTLQRT